jgi:hypothetical protein
MRLPMAWILAATLVAVPAAPVAAQTTIADIVGLKTAGLGDDILIALFQSDGTVFTLDADDLIYLRQQGISERVLLAMLRTRERPAPPVEAQPVDQAPPLMTPAPVIIEVSPEISQDVTVEVEQPERVVTRTEYVQVPVIVPVTRTRRIDSGSHGKPTQAPRASSASYWGFGGQRRPDSWGPSRSSAPAPRSSSSSSPRGPEAKAGSDKPETSRTTTGQAGAGGVTRKGGGSLQQ